jgi:histidinol-phosphate aminotransferase
MIVFKRCLLLLMLAICALFSFNREISKENEDKIISLNFNENPFRSSPLVQEAMSKALTQSAFYPDKEAEVFIAKLAEYHMTDKNRLLVGNGLSSLLHTVVDTFAGDGEALIMADPTFDFMAWYALERGGNIVKVSLNADYAHDLETMLMHVDASTKLIYICNPNNPTGTLTPREQIEDFLRRLPKEVYVFIDEAYHHFVASSDKYISFIDKPIEDDRVIVGRSFSKIYGLAGMRLGYLFSTPATNEKLKKHQAFDSNNRVALEAGIAALHDEAWMLDTVKKFEKIREEFYIQAEARELKYIPSQANFVMLETKGRSVQAILEHFERHHMKLGREFLPMNNHIRVSLGLPEHMERFWTVWDQLPL